MPVYDEKAHSAEELLAWERERTRNLTEILNGFTESQEIGAATLARLSAARAEIRQATIDEVRAEFYSGVIGDSEIVRSINTVLSDIEKRPCR